MDFRHLIVTCLFSKLRLPFDNQKVKENYAILILKHRCFETAVRIYFMNYVIILGKKIIFVTELYKYSDENIQVSRFLHIVNIFLM